MDALQGGRVNSTAAKNVVRFILKALLCIYQNPQVFGYHSLCILVYAAIHGFILYLVQRGSITERNAAENTASTSSDSLVCCTKNSSTPNVSESKSEALKSSKGKDDSTWENDLGKPADHSSPVLNPDSSDIRNRLSMLRMKDIISILGDCRAESVDIGASGKSDLDGFFKGLDFPPHRDTRERGNSLKKGIRVDLADTDINLHVPFTRKAPKVPEEHDWVGIEEESLTVAAKTSLCDHGALTREPSDTGSAQKGTSNPNKKGQTSPDGGAPSPGVVKVQSGSISYSSSSSSSGGDDGDGDDNRKQTGRIGGCQGCGESDVDTEDESEHVPKEQEPQDDVDNNDDDDCCGSEDNCSESQKNDESQRNSAQSDPQSSSSYSTVPGGSGESASQRNRNSSCYESAKKAAQPGLQIDVTTAKMEAQANIIPSESQVETEGISESESDKDLQKAFMCRQNLNSDREWQKCTDAFCQLIQWLLKHSENCRMRVLGGCKDCICFKDILLNHVLKCTLPLGQCVIARCDYIRKYMHTNKTPLPGNRKWTWALDQLFFRSIPPTTPTAEAKEEFLSAYEDGLAQAHTQADKVHDTHKDIVVADESSASYGELMGGADGWSQYHVDRPPDARVTRGPVIQESVELECKEYSPSSPLSAADVSVKSTCKSQIVGNVVLEEEWEVIWPLNQERLGVHENGSYIENIHWQVIHAIGGGSCGRCYLCRDVFKQSLIAIKKIPINKFESNEIQIWGGLSGRHPNILELYGAIKCRRSGTVIIFMEYMSGGSVEEYAGEMNCNEIWALHILGKVLSGVEFIHSQRILHRDIKGRPPWMDSCHGSLIYKIGTATEPPCSPPCSPEVEDLFSQGFILMPSRRKTARELLRHPAIMAAPDASGLHLPSWGDTEEYSDGACSVTSSSTGALESTASETSADQPLSDGLASDLEDDDDGNYSDCHDDDSDDDSDSHGDTTDLEVDFHLDALISLPQGAWQGAGLSAEEQFQSLQSDLVLSLSAEDLERHVLSNVINGVSENDVKHLRDDNFDVSRFGLDNLDIQSIDDIPLSSALPVTDWSYSITDLTKINIKDSIGNLLFTIRERSTTAYGRLAEDLHGNIASLLNLDSFSLTREDGTPLNVRAEIGPEEQTLRTVRAHDNDPWQECRWRVDDRGRVEEFFDLTNN
ncbi:Mitogen-activated protein kinase kinase kinase 14 [Stylophora pistillata]|uniref:Mitogen-activated protein kinase kinase kinase 14 n=1 Tax=Stylophora pistillata TaxID=50429 RepID=A0A2B4RCY6_STYPI|nr:Mitogen-activated protein kinase kinase kinase 14 [Stylophora pistillata]